MNKLLVLSGVLLLGACAPGQFMDRHNGTVPEMFAAGKRWLRERIIGRPKL
jgi:hypothetical protein